MKKGFTLIELLAVIIILAIVALIATPIVLDVVNDAKESAAKSEASMIVSGVNNYCAAAEMKEQLTGEESICKDGVTVDEVEVMVDLGNTKVLEIEYGNISTGEVAVMASLITARVEDVTKKSGVKYLKVESNDKIVTYDGSTYAIDGEIVDTPHEPEEPDEPVTPTPTPTYAAYSVGDNVTLSDGTTWVVVKDTTTNESEIKIMSTSNVKANLTTETGTAMFTTVRSEYVLAYDDDSNIWANSTLKAYLDGTVKTRLEASLGTTISDITIWGAEELTALGCTVTGNDTDGYSELTCDTTTTWYSKVFKNAHSWTKLPYAGISYYAWPVFGYGNFNNYSVSIVINNGARPVITISKSVISQ